MPKKVPGWLFPGTFLVSIAFHCLPVATHRQVIVAHESATEGNHRDGGIDRLDRTIQHHSLHHTARKSGEAGRVAHLRARLHLRCSKKGGWVVSRRGWVITAGNRGVVARGEPHIAGVLLGDGAGVLAAFTPNTLYICLLYTSPSPRDVEESRMPSSA